jgi:enoyl-CoA hydratase/carnithine racemase
LFCDVRFAARGARFSSAYSRRALPAEFGISFLLPRLIGVEKALDLLLSGRVFDAEEAHAIGLVSRLCPPETVLAEAQAYAADMAANCSPRAMAAIRRQVYGDLSRDYESALLDAVALMQDAIAHPDLTEGARSFAERRTPGFLPLEKDFRPREGEFPF